MSVSPDGKWLALFERSSLPSIEEIAQPELRLAGLRIDPVNFYNSRDYGYQGITLVEIATGKTTIIPVKTGPLFKPKWSPKSTHIAFLTKDQGLRLNILDISRQKLSKLTNNKINGALSRTPFLWHPTGGSIIALVREHNQPAKLQSEAILPIIQEATGTKAPARTYQDLIKTPSDEKLFEQISKSKLMSIGLDGSEIDLNHNRMIQKFTLSPNGEQVLVTSLAKPFLYTKTYQSFANSSFVIALSNKKALQVSSNKAAATVPKGYDSTRLGKRSIDWQPGLPSTLVWVEAQGDGSLQPDRSSDILYNWTYPFNKAKKLVKKLSWRFSSIDWSASGQAFITEWRFSDRQMRQWMVDLKSSESSSTVVQKRSYNDRYKDAGTLAKRKTPNDADVVSIAKDGAYFRYGLGASPAGNIPFIDRISMKDGKTQRLWTSEKGYYERVVYLIDVDEPKAIISRESPNEIANLYLLDVNSKKRTQLTFRKHPYPQFVGITKERIEYKRADGVKLSGNLYLPKGYKKSDGPLPTILWAYPLEYKDSSVAGQIRSSQYQFKRISYQGPLPYLAKGYAVFDNPTMPIIAGKSGQPNNTFIQQLKDSAKAAIDVLVDKGVTQRSKVAISGHSYGAFMVANLLAHTDLFATGIARSGAYNRSLTPFGFQGEERDFWEAQDVYTRMSPFFSANRINEPILFIHGDADNNSGTYPMQSRRMFAAIKGLGGVGRLVMLPHESHGYRARESLLHMLWEQEQWLDKHLKQVTSH